MNDGQALDATYEMRGPFSLLTLLNSGEIWIGKPSNTNAVATFIYNDGTIVADKIRVRPNGIMTVTPPWNFGGAIVVDGGTLTLSDTLAINNGLELTSGEIDSLSNSTIDVYGTSTITGGSILGPSTLTFGETISPTGSVTLTGGLLDAVTKAVFNQDTTFDPGTVVIWSDVDLNGNIAFDGGTLETTGDVDLNGDITFDGGTLETTGKVTLGGSATLYVDSLSGGTIRLLGTAAKDAGFENTNYTGTLAGLAELVLECKMEDEDSSAKDIEIVAMAETPASPNADDFPLTANRTIKELIIGNDLTGLPDEAANLEITLSQVTVGSQTFNALFAEKLTIQTGARILLTNAGTRLFYLKTNLDTNTTFREFFSGDANLDGFVGIADLNAVLGNWNQSGKSWATGALTGDRYVGIEDLNAVLSDWNKGVNPP